MGVMDNLKLTREPKDLMEMEMLNHAIAHELSFLSQQDGPLAGCLVLEVCQSAAGYYLGCQHKEFPVFHDSVEYWATREEAQAAMNNHSWTQKLDP